MRALVAAAVAAGVLLAACSHASTAPAPAASGNGRIGYVRMQDLVKAHPLYGQLAQIDDSIEALDLRSLAPQALAAGPELKREADALNAQLAAAAKRTNDLINAKGHAYQAREDAAIAAALRQAGVPNGPSVDAVRSQLDATAAGQSAGVNAQAQADLAAYRKQLEAQNMAEIEAAQRTLAARADRTYRAKADELTAKEAAASLKRVDAATRANAPVVSWDDAFGLVKINPLVTWTNDDVASYLADHNLPRHPLTSRGYRSIGCAPTTRPVGEGEDPRAGRWAGLDKSECGLHVTH